MPQVAFKPTDLSYLDKYFMDYINRPEKNLPMYDFLSQYLKTGAQEGMPYKQNLLQASTGAIRSQYDTAGRNLQDRLSSRGLGSSGIGLVAQNQLQGQESGAINEATNQVNAQDVAFRQNAIAQLLGLSTAEANYGLNQDQQSLGALSNLYGLKQNWNEFGMNYSLDYDKLNAAQKAEQLRFWSSLLGSAGRAAGAIYGMPSGGGGGFPSGSYDYAGSDASGYA